MKQDSSNRAALLLRLSIIGSLTSLAAAFIDINWSRTNDEILKVIGLSSAIIALALAVAIRVRRGPGRVRGFAQGVAIVCVLMLAYWLLVPDVAS